VRHSEISRAVAIRVKTSGRFAGQVLDAAVEVICEALERGERVELRRLGRFEVGLWKARTNHVLGGGTKRLPARRFVKFRMSQKLKRRVRGE